MVILKKIKGSTLMETLVATVILVIVFVLALNILNWMFFSAYKNDFNTLNSRFNELEYKIINSEIRAPYYEDYNDYEITINKTQLKKNKFTLSAENLKTKKTISRAFEY